LAVSTSDNGIKILVNADGHRLLRSFENRTFDAARVPSDTKVRVVHLLCVWLSSFTPNVAKLRFGSAGVSSNSNGICKHTWGTNCWGI